MCACCCACLCCCCAESTYLLKKAVDGSIAQATEEDMDTSELVIQMNRGPCSCPFCDGCCGGGKTWTILQDAARDKSKDPLQLYVGTEIGSLKRAGRGFLTTWLMPSHDSDHWTLDFAGLENPRDKLLTLAMVLWMDHSDMSQTNDADN
mmetsp:Transcript_56715/g.106911  ORF Transcript_56715/g.106911 Transcript_56715/m.106911 type:complete len:149 (+) Transcript_56715:1-447(+)